MTRPCPQCNQMNPADAAFCRNCSASLGLSGGAKPYQQPNAPYVGGQAPYVGAPQQYQGGQNFGMQGGGSAGGPSTRSIVSMCLAIAALVLCCGFLTGIPAAILGWMELDAIKNGQSPEAGKVFAQVGLWGGVAISVLSALFTVLWLFLSIIPFAM